MGLSLPQPCPVGAQLTSTLILAGPAWLSHRCPVSGLIETRSSYAQAGIDGPERCPWRGCMIVDSLSANCWTEAVPDMVQRSTTKPTGSCEKQLRVNGGRGSGLGATPSRDELCLFPSWIHMLNCHSNLRRPVECWCRMKLVPPQRVMKALDLPVLCVCTYHRDWSYLLYKKSWALSSHSL